MKKEERFLPKRLMQNFSVVGLWTLLSRILGFIRDILIAIFLGAGPVAEAFLVAFTLPNMFRRLFAEGAFNTAFIPLLSKKVIEKKEPEAFASDALSILIVILLTLTAVAEIIMPVLVFSTASGFTSDARFDLSVSFGRVMFPYILLISLSAFLGGILNTLNRYSVTAAAPLILNLFFIFALLFAYIFGFDFGWSLTICVPLAGLSQLGLLVFFFKKQQFALSIKVPRLTPEIMRLIKIAIPAAMAGGVIQINLVVGRQVASYFEGAVAWLNYADRIYQLPLGVIGIAIGIVLLPKLSKTTSKNLTRDNKNIINRSIEFALFFTMPATCALLIIPLPIISNLFERGAFTSIDSIQTSKALFVYGMGLPAFVFQKIFSTIYFSHGNTKAPFIFALIGMIVNLILAIGLTGVLGYLAPAVGTTLSGWLIAILLWKNSKVFNFSFDIKFKSVFLKLSLACFGFSCFLFTINYFFSDMLMLRTTKIFSFVIIILTSALFYLLLCQLIGIKKSLLRIQATK